MLGSLLGGVAKQALGGLLGGGSQPTAAPTVDTPMPQQGNVITAQDQGSVENQENTLGRAGANARARASMPSGNTPSGGRGSAEQTHNRSGVTTNKTQKQVKVEEVEAQAKAEGKSLKQWAIENAKSIGSELATDLIRNKATDALYGTKAEQDLDYMNTVYPNTDVHQRLGSGSGGALQATTAEKVARVNAKASKKVASIGQSTGAVARAQASKLRQEKKTEEYRTEVEKSNARWQDRFNARRTAMTEATAKGNILGVEIGGKRYIPDSPPVTRTN